MSTHTLVRPPRVQPEQVVRGQTKRLCSEHPRPTILVIEDDKSIHSLYRVALDEEHYGVVSCYNGASGLALSDILHPDVIILDLALPDISGVAVCRHLKSDPRTADIPVIFVTGTTEMDEMLSTVDLDAADFVVKPFDEGDLRARVQAVLKRHTREVLSSEKSSDNAASLDSAYEFEVRPIVNQSWSMLEHLTDQSRERLARMTRSRKAG